MEAGFPLAIDAAKLQVVVTADTKAAEAGLQSVNQKIQGTAKSAQQSGTAFGGLGKAMSGLKASGALAALGVASVGAAAVTTGKQVVAAAIDYESAFAGVRKTVDATEQEFASLSAGIRKMSMEIPASATAIAGVAEAAGQLGIQTDNILGFTRVMSDLGVATNMSAEQAATSLARLANITQMPQENFDRLGSTIVALGNSLATTEAEVTEMALRIAGAGKQIGLTEAEILSFAGALSSVGIEAQAGGSAISRTMIEMANAVASGTEELDVFAEVAGMTTAQFQQAFQQDAAGALISFIEGLNGVSEAGGNVFAVLDELGLSEIRVRDALLRASGAGDLFRQSIELGSAAWSENTALTKEAEQRYQTTASQIQIAKNAVNEIGIALGTVLLPAVVSVTGKLADLASGFADVVTAITESPDPVDVANRWDEAAKTFDGITIPEPPEEEGRRWGYFISDMLGHDWDEFEKIFERRDSPLREFDMPYLEFTDDDIARLERLLELTPAEGGLFAEEGRLAERMLREIRWLQQIADEWNRFTTQEKKNVKEAADWFASMWNFEGLDFMAGVSRDLAKSGPGVMAGKDDLSMDLLAIQNVSKDTSRVVRDELQAMGQGFVALGNDSERAVSQSTATFDRFATAFQGNTDLAVSSFDSLTKAIASGSIDFEQATSLYAGIPRDVLVPAVTEAAAQMRGKLADATLTEQEARAIEGQINALKIMFPDLVSEIDGVSSAFGNFGAIQDVFQQNISLAAAGVGEWEGHLSGAERALGFLQDKIDAGIPLTAEQQEQYDALTWAVERYTGGIDDEMAHLVSAEVAKAKFIQRQDELNQALADGTITQKEYDEAISEARESLDPMTAGQMDLVEATDAVIDRLRDFMIELGLIPPDVDTELTVDDEDANLTLDEFAEKIGAMPDPEMTLQLDTGTAYTQADAFRQAMRDNPATIDLFVNQIQQQGFTANNAQGGAITRDTLSWVGEEGPELVMLPAGSQVYNHHTSNEIAGRIPGFAQGTGGNPGGSGPSASATISMFNWDWLFGGLEAAAQHYSDAALKHIETFVKTASGSLSMLKDAMSLHDAARSFQGFAPPEVISGLVDNAQAITQEVGDSAALFKSEFLEHAAEYAGAAGSGVALLKDAADLMATLDGANVNLDKAKAAASALKFLVEHITFSIGDTAAYVAHERPDGFVAQADLFSQSALSGVELMDAGAALMGALADLPRVYDLESAKAAVSDLKFLIEHITFSIGDTAAYVDANRPDGFVQRAGVFSESAGQAVELVGQGLEFISALAEYDGTFDMADSMDWASNLKFLVEHIAFSIGDSAAYLKQERPEEFLEGIAAYAEAVQPAVAILADMVALLDGINEMKPSETTDAELVQTFARLADLAREAAIHAAGASATWGDEVNPQLEAFHDDVSNALGILSGTFDILDMGSLDPTQLGQNFDAAFAFLYDVAVMAAESAKAASATWKEKADPALEAFAADTRNSLGVITEAGSAIGEILAFGQIGKEKEDKRRKKDIKTLADEMLGTVTYLIARIQEMEAEMGGPGIEAAAEFAVSAEESMGMFSAAADAFAAIDDHSTVTKAKAESFTKNFKAVLNLVRSLNEMGKEYLSDAISFQTLMEKIAGAMEAAAGAIDIAAGKVSTSASGGAKAGSGGGSGSGGGTWIGGSRGGGGGGRAGGGSGRGVGPFGALPWDDPAGMTYDKGIIRDKDGNVIGYDGPPPGPFWGMGPDDAIPLNVALYSDDPELAGEAWASIISWGSHGGGQGGIESYIDGLLDPNYSVEKGNALIRSLTTILQQHPEWWNEPAFWRGVQRAYPDMPLHLIKSLVRAYQTGNYYIHPIDGSIAIGHNIFESPEEQTYRIATQGKKGRSAFGRNPFEEPPEQGSRAFGTQPGGYHSAEARAIREEEAQQRSQKPGGGREVVPFADGGVIDRPLLALMGEAGPEMVQPLSHGHPERERFIKDIVESVVRVIGQGGGDRAATFVVDGQVFAEVAGKRVMHTMPTKAGL